MNVKYLALKKGATPREQNEPFTKSSGVHIFFTHDNYVMKTVVDDSASKITLPTLLKLFGQSQHFYDLRESLEIEEDVKLLILGPKHKEDVAFIPKAKAFLGVLRGKIDENYYDKKVLYILAHSILWDLLIDREQSVIFPDEYNVFEYILWPNSELLLQDHSTNHQETVWRGIGGSANYFQPPITISNGMNFVNRNEKNLQSLAWFDEQLVADSRPTDDRPLLFRDPTADHLETLCQFLPFYWNTRAKHYFPPVPGGSYGPIKLKADLLDLTMHQRQLLLDGWLTPWTYKDKLYIQPSALSLLYWAANKRELLQAETPKHFFDYFAWFKNDAWFGGQWRPEMPKDRPWNA